MDRLKVSELRSLGMAPSKVGKDFHTWLKDGSRVRSTEAVAEGWLHSSARNHRKGFLVESKVEAKSDRVQIVRTARLGAALEFLGVL